MTNRRLPAEWEPQRFVQFTFPHRESDWAYMYDEVAECFSDLITSTAQFVPVLVVCADMRETAEFIQGETEHPILFVEQPSNDTWARDHGAITVMDGGQPLLLDFTFNGWGQKFEASLDNKISQGIHSQGILSDDLQPIDFVLEGGAIESDGKGTLLTTSECLLSKFRNPQMSKEEIEAFLKDIFGLQQVLWLDHGYLAGDDTDSHIDTLARLCDENTIAYVKCDDQEDEHFEALEKMEAQLKSFKKLDGEPYQLVELPWPEACFDEDGQRLPATYANFLITNEAVLVPTYNVAQDDKAVLAIQNIFPNHKVVGVNCRPLIEQHGSLHCITMQYPESVNVSWL